MDLMDKLLSVEEDDNEEREENEQENEENVEEEEEEYNHNNPFYPVDLFRLSAIFLIIS